MGECRFNKEGRCLVHTENRVGDIWADAALCISAAADLERRVVEMGHVIHIDTDHIAALESRLARLEEEKAQVEASLLSATRRASCKPFSASWWGEKETP